jgi:hypothetical protein
MIFLPMPIIYFYHIHLHLLAFLILSIANLIQTKKESVELLTSIDILQYEEHKEKRMKFKTTMEHH